MKNLTPYNKNTIDFHDLVLARKHNTQADLTYKERVIALRDFIVEKFDEFDPLFDTNNLLTINCYGFGGANKTDLLKLYSYKSRTLQELKVTVTTLENNRSLNTCQYCTLNEINSFDHYLPKDEFAEFVVNPKNLIPCCTNCNSKKGEIWRNNNLMQFVNLYKDQLPNQQYLFVEILDNSGVIQPKFFLDNRNMIDKAFYNLLLSHYDKLNLTERFNENSNHIVTELENLIISQKVHLDRNQIVEVVMYKTTRDKLKFGHNYWKPILEQELVNSRLFMDRLF
jgi:hypothetical protein